MQTIARRASIIVERITKYKTQNMKKATVLLMTTVLAVMLAGCAATSIDTSGGRDGSSFDKAVIVGSVRAEYPVSYTHLTLPTNREV